MRRREFEANKLDPGPRYFGTATIGESVEDPESKKSDRYCEILGFEQFDSAVPIKLDDAYFEEIPTQRNARI